MKRRKQIKVFRDIIFIMSVMFGLLGGVLAIGLYDGSLPHRVDGEWPTVTWIIIFFVISMWLFIEQHGLHKKLYKKRT